MSDRVITINVGKKGINDNLIREINTLLEKRGVVKVRMLRNFRNITMGGVDRKTLAREIAERVDGELVDFRGFVLTFKRC
ncbi:YhbY family RNA-binding protein [Geoglobus sp.]